MAVGAQPHEFSVQTIEVGNEHCRDGIQIRIVARGARSGQARRPGWTEARMGVTGGAILNGSRRTSRRKPVCGALDRHGEAAWDGQLA